MTASQQGRNRHPARIGLRLIQTALGIGLIAYLLWFLTGQQELIQRALNIHWAYLLAISLFIWLSWLSRAIQMSVLLKALGKHVGLHHLMGLVTASVCLNYLPIQAGFAMSAVWLKRQVQLRYTKYMSLWTASVGLGEVSAGLWGIIGTLAAPGIRPSHRAILVAIFSLAVIVPISLALVPLPEHLMQPGRLRRMVTQFVVGLKRISRDRKALWQSCFIQSAFNLAQAARVYAALWACGFNVDPFAVLAMHSLGRCATAVFITPGGLGVREGAIGIAGNWLAIGWGPAIMAAAIDRAMLMLWALMIGLPSVFWIGKGTTTANVV